MAAYQNSMKIRMNKVIKMIEMREVENNSISTNNKFKFKRMKSRLLPGIEELALKIENGKLSIEVELSKNPGIYDRCSGYFQFFVNHTSYHSNKGSYSMEKRFELDATSINKVKGLICLLDKVDPFGETAKQSMLDKLDNLSLAFGLKLDVLTEPELIESIRKPIQPEEELSKIDEKQHLSQEGECEFKRKSANSFLGCRGIERLKMKVVGNKLHIEIGVRKDAFLFEQIKTEYPFSSPITNYNYEGSNPSEQGSYDGTIIFDLEKPLFELENFIFFLNQKHAFGESTLKEILEELSQLYFQPGAILQSVEATESVIKHKYC